MSSRPEKDVEILEIDDASKLLQNATDANEASQFSNIFGGASTCSSWSNAYDTITERRHVYRYFGLNLQRLGDDG